MTTIIEQKINYTCHIKKIIHISDIHIQLYKRHDEYLKIFEKLYLALQKEKEQLNIPKEVNTNLPIIIIVTGDLLHSKCDLSPECIHITYNFLKSLSNIMPTIVIPGNHDLNMNNKERLDSITPIIADLPSTNPIHYLTKTGTYQFNNIILSHASIFDYNIIDPNTIKNDSSLTKIALYHGRVNGAELFNGLSINGEVNKLNNKTITPSSFKNYDLVLLGDIHKHQFIQPHMAYAGSLIQQNNGETAENHGYIKWDIETKKGTFHHIDNDYSYVTLNIDNKKADHLCYIDNKHCDDCHLTKNLRIRILYKNTPISYITDYITLLKINHNVLEYTFQNNEELDTQQDSTEKHKSLNITTPESQNQYIESFLKDNTDATEQEINIIKQINNTQNKQLESNINFQNSNFKILKLEFSNLFSYGADNSVDFTNFKGVVGIIAPNHMGKSSILDIIIYTLFDKFSRKGNIKDIINNRKTAFQIKLSLQIGEWIYFIEKSGKRSSHKSNCKVRVDVKFYRQKINSIIVDKLEGDSVINTKKNIMSYFGQYEDFINTSFSIQNNSNTFIDADNVERRKELERILRFDFINELIKMATTVCSKYKNILDHLKLKINPDAIKNTLNTKKECETKIIIIDKKKNIIKKRIDSNNNEIMALMSQINLSAQQDYDSLQSEYNNDDNIEEKVSSLANKLDLLNNTFNQKKDKLDSNNLKLLEYSNIELNTYFDNLTSKAESNQEAYTKKINKYSNEINNLHSKHLPSSNLNITHNEIEQYQKELITLQEKLTIIQEKDKELSYINTINETEIETELEYVVNEKNEILKNLLPNDLLELIKDVKKGESRKKLKSNYMELFNIISKLDINESIFNNKKYQNLDKKLRDEHIYMFLLDYNNSKERKKTLKDKDELITHLTNKLSTFRRDYKMKNEYNKCIIEIKNKTCNLDMQIKNEKQNLENNTINEQNKLKIEEFKIKLSKYQKNYEQEEKKKKEYLKCKQFILLLQEDKNKIDDIAMELLSCQEFIDSNSKLIRLIQQNNQINIKINQIREENTKNNQILEETEREFNLVQMEYSKSKTLIEQYKKDNKELKVMENKLYINELYKKSLKQLPYLLIDKIVPYLEKKTNDLLSIITEFYVEFKVNDTKIDIYIKRANIDGLPIILNNASGFEKFISSLAIRIALIEISNLPKINFMAIDEGWSCFDSHNINNLNIIFEHLCQKFEFILTISHLNEIKQYCDTQIGIKKESNGFSSITV